MDRSERFVLALERAGYEATPSRRLVAELVAAPGGGHFTAADVLERARMRGSAIGRATIFRALELFATLHIVERLDLPNGAHAYVACQPDEHHHHLVCSGCGRSVDVQDGELRAVVEEIGRRSGYRIESHRLELFGVCPECTGSAQP